MKRVALHTLGCKLNVAETAWLGKQFVEQGYALVDIDQPADVVVLNTCSVTKRADRECRQVVRRALRHSPGAYVAVVGCYAQLQPAEIASIKGVDLVLGAKEKFNLLDHVGEARKCAEPRVLVSPIQEVSNFGFANSAGYADRTRAFLKIQDGCDYNCSFCTIPLARGVSRSIPPTEVIRQAREIVGQGFKEVVLTGVNVGDYGKKTGENLLSLVRQLVLVDGLERIRISSVEPNLLSDELLDFWFTEKKLCKHWHLPLQSGNDEILKSMRRRYLRDWYANRLHRITENVPDAGIGADVIVGFPGETKELFAETYQFIVELPVTYLHVFTYSERPNTSALNIADPVEPRVRAERSERLRTLSIRKRRAFYESFVGKTVNVLFETEKAEGWMTGLTSQYVRIDVRTERLLTNNILPVRVLNSDSDSCAGELLHSPEPDRLGIQASKFAFERAAS